MPVVFEELYNREQVAERLAATLGNLIKRGRKVVFLCIGTDRNLLDCLGPLTGTMLQEKMPYLTVYGNLERPLHAQNLTRLLKDIRQKHEGSMEIAIDASVGSREQLGLIKVREGSIMPGKAMSRRLPEVGDVSITGVVTTRPLGNKPGIFHDGSIAPVYYMAKTITEAIRIWDQQG